MWVSMVMGGAVSLIVWRASQLAAARQLPAAVTRVVKMARGLANPCTPRTCIKLCDIFPVQTTRAAGRAAGAAEDELHMSLCCSDGPSAIALNTFTVISQATQLSGATPVRCARAGQWALRCYRSASASLYASWVPTQCIWWAKRTGVEGPPAALLRPHV